MIQVTRFGFLVSDKKTKQKTKQLAMCYLQGIVANNQPYVRHFSQIVSS